jgi:predicted  nucleic acid-binding Zn-ribbon protein
MQELVKKYSILIIMDKSEKSAIRQLAAKILAMINQNPNIFNYIKDHIMEEFPEWEKDWNELERRLKKQADRVDMITRENVELSNKYKNAQARIDELERQLGETEETLDQCHKICKGKEAEIRELIAQIKKLGGGDQQVDDSAEIKKLKKQNKDLRESVKTLGEKKKRAQDAADPEKILLQQIYATLCQKYDELYGSAKTLENESERLEGQVNNLGAAIHDLNSDAHHNCRQLSSSSTEADVSDC